VIFVLLIHKYRDKNLTKNSDNVSEKCERVKKEEDLAAHHVINRVRVTVEARCRERKRKRECRVMKAKKMYFNTGSERLR
jgi:hypothetical protein